MRWARGAQRGRGSQPRRWQMRWPLQTSGGTRSPAAPRRGRGRRRRPPLLRLRRARRRIPKKGWWPDCLDARMSHTSAFKTNYIRDTMQHCDNVFCIRVAVWTGQRPRTPSQNGAKGKRNRRILAKTWMKHHLFLHRKRETHLKPVLKCLDYTYIEPNRTIKINLYCLLKVLIVVVCYSLTLYFVFGR